MGRIQAFIPALQWLPNYNKEDLSGDVSAGMIVAVMLIPQGMAYAMLAGLPPVIGLYSATIPLFVYALLGSSKQLAVGPVAIVSLLVFSGVSSLAEPGTDEYIAYVFLLSLMVGVIKLILGLLRLGVLVNFVSHAVISGFTSAAAIIIGLSQLNHLLGFELPQSENVFVLLLLAAQQFSGIHPLTFLLGLGSIAVMVFLKRVAPRFPAPLLVVAGSTLIVYLFQLDQWGVKIVGDIPKGIPRFSLPAFSMESITSLFPIAITIAFIGYMESIAIAKAIASKENYQVDANKELRALGLANIVGSFFSSYPVTGGFSRSAVNYQSGARTGLASMITVFLIFLTLLFFTPVFYYLPRTVLAAIIMVAVFGLIDVKEAKRLFQLKKVDGWTLLITFVATLVLGIEDGILLGVAVSLLVFIARSARPHTAVLGDLSKQNVFHNIAHDPEVKTEEDILIFRMDASLYYPNMAFLEEKLRAEVDQRPKLQWIILDFSGVNDMDGISVDTWERIIDRYQEKGISFLLVGIKGSIRDLVTKACWPEKYGEIAFQSLHEALQSIEAEGMLE